MVRQCAYWASVSKLKNRDKVEVKGYTAYFAIAKSRYCATSGLLPRMNGGMSAYDPKRTFALPEYT
jgi:hypothetical protein